MDIQVVVLFDPARYFFQNWCFDDPQMVEKVGSVRKLRQKCRKKQVGYHRIRFGTFTYIATYMFNYLQ